MTTATLDETLLLSKARIAGQAGLGGAIRRAAGLSQAEVAKAVGVTQVTVSRWESGERKPRGAAAIRYGELLERLAPSQAAA